MMAEPPAETEHEGDKTCDGEGLLCTPERWVFRVDDKVYT
jgi:hypothetical protein